MAARRGGGPHPTAARTHEARARQGMGPPRAALGERARLWFRPPEWPFVLRVPFVWLLLRVDGVAVLGAACCGGFGECFGVARAQGSRKTNIKKRSKGEGAKRGKGLR